jgi:alkylhydroperoxidase family enzyme
MAHIEYRDEAEIPEALRVPDHDHILRIHSVHPEVMRHHYDLYVELMHRPGPLSRRLREMIAVVVSAANRCHY